jgi:hypothetical protein
LLQKAADELETQGKFGAAMERYSEMLRVTVGADPGVDFEVRFRFGECCLRGGHPKNARKHFQAALTLAEAESNNGKSFACLGERESRFQPVH